MIRKDEVAGRLMLNEALAVAALADFLRDGVENAGSTGLVLGLSGGVDSALAAALAVRALGTDRVHALYLPYRTSDPQSAVDAAAVAAKFGLALTTIDITPQIDAYFDRVEPEADRVRRGNKMARERMTILFDQSKKYGALVDRNLEQERDSARLLDRSSATTRARSTRSATSTSSRSGSCHDLWACRSRSSRSGRRPTSGRVRPRRASSASSTRWPTRCSI